MELLVLGPRFYDSHFILSYFFALIIQVRIKIALFYIVEFGYDISMAASQPCRKE